MAFKRARVIGATVVGAARRLDALRAAEPFAMVVEEACEVMEPVLMSVLAVPSLRKLELVGDHYQLPAFVQNCWYNMEATHPALKVSLFERLVVGTSKGLGDGTNRRDGGNPVVPCSILDEQRRMRPAIADLTRDEYRHLVAIQDHGTTRTRRLGDVLLAASKSQPSQPQAQSEVFRTTRKLWAARGALVPGVPAQEFFWNLRGNAEGRPVAGLSACNQVEAAAVAQLVKWLLLCGVPAPAIAVITPYKGQKTAIIHALRKVGSVGPHQHREPFRPGTVHVPSWTVPADVVISTVDRFQGDENDVVILSLVRTRPGNRFVALRNRFIVAASRARLGFFVVGSTSAVGGAPGGRPGPRHWAALLSRLAAPTSEDEQHAKVEDEEEEEEETKQGDADDDGYSDGGDGEEGVEVITSAGPSDQTKRKEADTALATQLRFKEARVGPALPICCPQHPSTQKSVDDTTGFPTPATWTSFCSVPCVFQLPWCGHTCGKGCHALQPLTHTTQKECAHPLQRPCIEHAHVPLSCGELFEQGGLGMWHGKPATGGLPKALAQHRCEVEVEYQRPECEHAVRLPCHQNFQIIAGKEKLKPCIEPVGDFHHPACNHVFPAPTCSQRRTWESKPPRCEERVTLSRECGHSQEMACWRAMEEEDEKEGGARVCQAAVEAVRPRCTHALSLRCAAAAELEELWSLQGGAPAGRTTANDPTSLTVEHGVQYGPSETQLAQTAAGTGRAERGSRKKVAIGAVPECVVRVRYRRACGHVMTNVRCGSAFSWAAGEGGGPQSMCDVRITKSSPLCGHTVKLPCWAAAEELWTDFPSPLATNTTSTTAAHVLPEAALSGLPALPPGLARVMRLCCSGHSEIERACGHRTRVPCSTLGAVVAGAKLPPCKSSTTRRLPCGHDATVLCHVSNAHPPPICRATLTDAFTFSCGRHSVRPGTCAALTRLRATPNPVCPEIVTCRRFRCGHAADVSCALEAVATEARAGTRLRPGTAASSTAVVEADVDYCDEAPGLPPCVERVTFRHECGHEVEGVPCGTAFLWADDAPPPCDALVEVGSPWCGHVLTLPCWQAVAVAGWEPWGADGGDLSTAADTVTVGFDGRSGGGAGSALVCRVFRHGVRPAEEALPKGLPPTVLRCGQTSVVERACGHCAQVPCERALDVLNKEPCGEMISEACPTCGALSTATCAEWLAQRETGLPRQCTNKVAKNCTICGVNRVRVECHKQAVRCEKEASAELPCGHTVSWVCGEEEDPRGEGAPPCIGCILPRWDAALKAADDASRQHKDATTEEAAAAVAAMAKPPALEVLLQRALDALPEGIEVEERLLSAGDGDGGVKVQPLRRAWRTILQSYRDALRGCYDNSTRDIPVRDPPSLADLARFDVVFTPETDSKVARLGFPPMSFTPYGQGQMLWLMTPGSVRRACEKTVGAEGLVRIQLGVAFSHHPLTGVPPFVATNGRANEKMRKAANKASRQQVACGFDCVESRGGKAATGDGDVGGPARRIYWVPGAAVPLAVLTLRLHRQCTICLDHHLRVDGCVCPADHFLCWDCMQAMVDAARSADATRRQVSVEGHLCCPTAACTQVFDIHHVSRPLRKRYTPLTQHEVACA